MDAIRKIVGAVEKGILLPKEGSRLIFEFAITRMETVSEIDEVFQLCTEELSASIKQILADLPVLECDWRRRTTLTSNGITSRPPEQKTRMIALREYCHRSRIALPPTRNPELSELSLNPSEILEIDSRPWIKNCIYDYVEKYVVGGPLAVSPQAPSHGATPKRLYSLEEMEGNPYLGRLWGLLLQFHPWERTITEGCPESATILLVGMEKNLLLPSRLAVIRGGDSLSVLDRLIDESNACMHDDYDAFVCERFETGASFALRGTPAETVAQALLLAKLSRQRLLADLKSQ